MQKYIFYNRQTFFDIRLIQGCKSIKLIKLGLSFNKYDEKAINIQLTLKIFKLTRLKYLIFL